MTGASPFVLVFLVPWKLERLLSVQRNLRYENIETSIVVRHGHEYQTLQLQLSDLEKDLTIYVCFFQMCLYFSLRYMYQANTSVSENHNTRKFDELLLHCHKPKINISISPPRPLNLWADRMLRFLQQEVQTRKTEKTKNKKHVNTMGQTNIFRLSIPFLQLSQSCV